MKRYNYIVQTGKEPSIDTLWIHRNNLKFFNNGTWCTIEGSVTKDWVQNRLEEFETTDFDTLGVVKAGKLIAGEIFNPKTWFENAGVDPVTGTCPVALYSAYTGLFYPNDRVLGNLSNSVFSAIVGEELHVYNIDSVLSMNVPSTPDKIVNLGSIPPFIDLKTGSSSDILLSNKNNLQKVAGTQFFAHIDNGIGMGAWLTTTGGYATINTAQGDRIHYKLGTNGSVAEDNSSLDHSDLFYEVGDTANPINLASFATEATQAFIVDTNAAHQLKKAAYLTLCCVGDPVEANDVIWVTCPLTSIMCSDTINVDNKSFKSPTLKMGQTSWTYLEVSVSFAEGQATVIIKAIK